MRRARSGPIQITPRRSSRSMRHKISAREGPFTGRQQRCYARPHYKVLRSVCDRRRLQAVADAITALIAQAVATRARARATEL